MDPKDTAALTIHKAKIGKELALLSPEVRHLIERAAGWSGSRLAADLRAIPRKIDRLRAESEAERAQTMARMVLGECLTHWLPEQIKASRRADSTRLPKVTPEADLPALLQAAFGLEQPPRLYGAKRSTKKVVLVFSTGEHAPAIAARYDASNVFCWTTTRPDLFCDGNRIPRTEAA